MKTLPLQIIFLTFIMLYGCNSSKKQHEEPQAAGIVDTHNSQNALDWDGFYTGTLPCADCEGIYTTITLNTDGNYIKKNVYLGKSDAAFEESGSFTWNDAGTTITLKQANEPYSYFVGENTLTALDMEGNKITGEPANNYVLHKKFIALTGVKWKLIKLNGKDVSNDRAYISFSEDNSRVSGNGGCNGFGGEYTTQEGNRISMSKLMSTMMACPDMETETNLHKALEIVDNYAILNDTLSLNKARMAPLAVFVADFTE